VASPSPNRRERRANAAEVKKVERATGKLTALHTQVEGIGTIVKKVIRQVDALRQGFNENHRAYTLALSAVDGHLSVMRAVINDIWSDKVHTLEDGNIDWDSYYTWYNEFVAQEREKLAERAKEEGRLVTAEEVDEEVFGGNYQGASDDQESASGSGEVSPGGQQATGEDDRGNEHRDSP
jgi:hypothetical protein